MIKRAQDMEIELREKMRGGNGTVKILHIFDKGELPSKSRLLAHMTLEKGCSIGFHEHVNETEIFYFLRGQGVVNDNGQSHKVSAGDALKTGNGTGHSVENTGNEPLEFIAVIIMD
ncbi:cupin domain-containing protein [Caldanaerobius polysaccharolyticus]|uniref:cupin domain-containing protein n=1 Tax=Caldanaerobius polysaccharolyticus TaxID=44256 RepID=UPI00047E2AD6|nr:cupin domain-containing protein [Caldanaerobius polysaccharolyticus]